MYLGLPNDGPNSKGNMPFSPVYGSEAVIPLEKQIPSLPIAPATKMTEGDNDRLRL